MLKKIFSITILFVIFSLSSFAQDNRPAVNIEQQIRLISFKEKVSKYPGYIININPGYFRFRAYSSDCLQLTYIVGNHYQLRLYAYYDIIDKKLSNALSFRYIIKYKNVR